LLDALRAGDLDLLFGVLRRPAWAIDVREEFLFSNPYAIVVRRQHPLARIRNVTLRDLAGYDWILPARGAPRREAFERLFAGAPRSPIVSIETSSSAIYKSVLATTDKIALLSTLEAQFTDPEALTIVPFDSPELARADGVATRADWHSTRLHQQFLDLLRREARDYLEARTPGAAPRRARALRS
jgi:LysR family transcriptional regulator, regulator for genes of the gallate degradation pathway